MRVRRMTLLPPPRPPPLPLPLSLARTICESEIVINERVKCPLVVQLQVFSKKKHTRIFCDYCIGEADSSNAFHLICVPCVMLVVKTFVFHVCVYVCDEGRVPPCQLMPLSYAVYLHAVSRSFAQFFHI